MVTLRLEPAEATVANVAAKLGLSPQQLDPSFGVIELDGDQKLYAILVDEKIAAKLAGDERIVGTHANPRIETFGPPQK